MIPLDWLGWSVCLHNREEQLALEWLEPVTVAEQILDSIESQLIYHFQPWLNDSKTKTYTARRPIVVHVQSSVGTFLDDVFIYPPNAT